MSMYGFGNNLPPTLWFKSTSNDMPNAPSEIEGSMIFFEKTLHTSVLSNTTFNTNNATKLQENTLNHFQSHLEHVILYADRNLGPFVMSSEWYIHQRMAQHLSNEKHYEMIDESVSQECMDKRMGEFLHCIKHPNLKLQCECFKHLHQENENI